MLEMRLWRQESDFRGAPILLFKLPATKVCGYRGVVEPLVKVDLARWNICRKAQVLALGGLFEKCDVILPFLRFVLILKGHRAKLFLKRAGMSFLGDITCLLSAG